MLNNKKSEGSYILVELEKKKSAEEESKEKEKILYTFILTLF